MRLAFGLSLMLLGVLWLAATLETRRPVESQAAHWKNAPAGTQWRRTARGWQRADEIMNFGVDDPRPLTPTALSPWVVATLQLLISVLALLVFPVRTKARTSAIGGSVVPQPVSKPPPAKKKGSSQPLSR